MIFRSLLFFTCVSSEEAGDVDAPPLILVSIIAFARLTSVL